MVVLQLILWDTAKDGGTEVSEGSETIDVFCSNQYGDIWDDYMVYENGKWRWNDFGPDFWMVPPKLPR